jgi:hypothetical protein
VEVVVVDTAFASHEGQSTISNAQCGLGATIPAEVLVVDSLVVLVGIAAVGGNPDLVDNAAAEGRGPDSGYNSKQST